MSEEGQRTLFPPQKHEQEPASRGYGRLCPIQSNNSWSGGPGPRCPGVIGIKAAVARYGSPAINRILQAD